ncbi:hypothetical protein M0R45_029387 [Rubus argutus]|uniref:Uncharacterized protein n=1 Tax=Rubus argutus TaxID=59490 RepID=A0AAW1WAE0_RUBAR
MGTGCSKDEASQSQKQSDHNHEAKLKQVQVTEKTIVAQVKKQQQQLPHNYEAIVRCRLTHQVCRTPVWTTLCWNILEPKEEGKPCITLKTFIYIYIMLLYWQNFLILTALFLPQGKFYSIVVIISKQGQLKYWLDKKSNNCFMVYPRDLNITWGEDNRYWQWPSLEETSNVFIEAAELLDVCWLNVEGKFDTTKLTPGILYEVVFVVMLKATGYGWEIPVIVRLTLPDGNKHERKVNFLEKAIGQWIEIPVGEFRVLAGKLGDIEYVMHQSEGGKWKSGLLIKGVTIRPKK